MNKTIVVEGKQLLLALTTPTCGTNTWISLISPYDELKFRTYCLMSDEIARRALEGKHE